MEALINFQTMVADLTGMEIANASLLDEATAAAEAMTLAKRMRARAGATSSSSPATAIRRRSRCCARAPSRSGIEVKVGCAPRLHEAAATTSACLPQYPTTTGLIHDMRPLVEQRMRAGALFCVAADLLALTLLEAPGAWGADIVVGNSQRFGVPFGFGGPHAASLACKDAFKRSMPGRLVGVSVDSQGQAGVPADAADARTAHPPRKGHVEHLHGAGAARRDGEHVCRLPRTRRPGAHRAAGAPPHRASWPKACAGLVCRSTARYFDTLTVGGVDAAKVHAAARAAGINLRVFGARDFGERAGK